MQGTKEHSNISRKASDPTKGYVEDTFDPTKRAAADEAGVAKKEKYFGELLAKQATEGAGGITAATTGALSDAYTRSKAGVTQHTHTLSRLLSRQSADGGLFNRKAPTIRPTCSAWAPDPGSRATARRSGSAKRAPPAPTALLGGLLSGSAGPVASTSKTPTPKPAGLSRQWQGSDRRHRQALKADKALPDEVQVEAPVKGQNPFG